MGVLRRGPGQGPAGQEVEGAAERRERVPGDLQVPCGGIERLRAAQHLDRPDVAPRFQEGGRATLAERMDTVAVWAPCGPLGVRGDFLRGAAGQGPVGSKARQEPRRWPGKRPGGAQCGQQARGEQRGAILAPFALRAADEPPITCDIRQPQPDDFAAAPARGIGGHQEGAGPRSLGARAQALAFRDAQHLWELRPPCPWGEGEDIPTERLGSEELAPRSRLLAGTPRQAPFGQEGVQVCPTLLWP
jgi:hypothetical protein